MKPMRYDADHARGRLRSLLSRNSGRTVILALAEQQEATSNKLVDVTGLAYTTVRQAISRARQARMVTRTIGGQRGGGPDYRYRLTDEGAAFAAKLTAGQP